MHVYDVCGTTALSILTRLGYSVLSHNSVKLYADNSLLTNTPGYILDCSTGGSQVIAMGAVSTDLTSECCNNMKLLGGLYEFFIEKATDIALCTRPSRVHCSIIRQRSS